MEGQLCRNEMRGGMSEPQYCTLQKRSRGEREDVGGRIKMDKQWKEGGGRRKESFGIFIED